LFAEAMAALPVGDPMDEGTKVGPLATESGREDVEELVKDAVDKGARVVVGGTRPDGPGWFYPPTLITDLTPEMRMYREEVFGPVAGLFRVPDLDAAVELANDSEFGLGSNIWTDDPAEQERFIRDVQAGMVFVNGMTTSYPELPFGGVKASGYGRELTEIGMREFLNIKSVWVGADSSSQKVADTGDKNE
jgi:succinate-semialdehyde dehydrogenase/glutarate-semialdehyde dehydrogenase